MTVLIAIRTHYHCLLEKLYMFASTVFVSKPLQEELKKRLDIPEICNLRIVPVV